MKIYNRPKDNYEMRFWTQEKDKAEHYNECYTALMQLWNIDSSLKVDAIAEIGTGPFGGFLPFFNASKKVSIDPLNDRYTQEGVMKTINGVEYVSDDFENIEFGNKAFDAIFTKNALDHGDMDFKQLIKIGSILKDGGRFYLHVNLRTQEQLNEGHDHSLTYDDFIKYSEEAGLSIVSSKVWDHDPIHGDGYHTLIAVLQK